MYRLLVLIVWAVAATAIHAQPPRSPGSAPRLTFDAPPALAVSVGRLEALSLSVLADDLARAGLALPDRIHVTLVPEADERARVTPDWIVGLAFGESDIVIFPERVLPYPYDSLESVFRHEAAHLALSSRAGGEPLPRWFHEGLAMSVDTGWSAAGRFRLLLGMVGDPGTADLSRLFAAGEESEAAQAYGLAAALVADLRRRHGDDVPGQIATRVALGMPFAEAFERETGESPDEAATRAWAAYRRWTRWLPAATSDAALWGGILALAVLAFAVRLRQRAHRRTQWNAEADAEP